MVIAAGAVTVYLAIATEDGLVAGDYYRQGLGINRRLEKEQRASDLGVLVGLDVGPGGDTVSITMKGHARRPSGLTLTLLHRTKRGLDQSVRLHAAPGNRYEGRLLPARDSLWRVVIEDDMGEWRLSGDWPGASARSILTPQR